MAPLKRDAVAALVRDMIADGTLKPGGAVPSGLALARETGYSIATCRAALRALLDGRDAHARGEPRPPGSGSRSPAGAATPTRRRCGTRCRGPSRHGDAPKG